MELTQSEQQLFNLLLTKLTAHPDVPCSLSQSDKRVADALVETGKALGMHIYKGTNSLGFLFVCYYTPENLSSP